LRSFQKRLRRMLDLVFPNCGKLSSSWVLSPYAGLLSKTQFTRMKHERNQKPCSL